MVSCGLFSTVFLALSSAHFMAEHLSEGLDGTALRRSVALEPGNADKLYRLGLYELHAEHDPQTALQGLKSAAALNPHDARYWLALSAAYQLLGQNDLRLEALERAVSSDPKNPEVAWEAANLYWMGGDPEKALREFGLVMQGDPDLFSAALLRCWQISPQVDPLLQNVIPRNAEAYSSFLDLLIAKNETTAAHQLWAQIVKLQQPIERRYVFDYVQYLIARHEAAQSRSVWRQAGILSDLLAYQPTPLNLIVNGNLSLPMLNAGLDWLYERSSDVAMALDPTEAISGHPSLSLTFDSRGMEDAGIRQLIPVAPGTKYEFSADFKAQDMQGAGGPRFVIQDAYSGATWFSSGTLNDAESWKRAEGTFTTGSDASLAVLRIQQFPAGNAIRGRLWTGNVRLTELTPGSRRPGSPRE